MWPYAFWTIRDFCRGQTISDTDKYIYYIRESENASILNQKGNDWLWSAGPFELALWWLQAAWMTKSPTVLQGRERLHYKGYIYHTDLSLLSTLGLLLWLCETPDQLHWECSLRWSGGPHQYGHFLSEGTRGWSACTVLNTPSWSTAFWAPGRWSGGVCLTTDIMNQIKGHRTEI